MNKQIILEQMEANLKIILPPGTPLKMSCFYYSIALYAAIHKHDKFHRPLIQAGSASLLAVPDELDDGVSPTHYSYVYEGWNPFVTLPEIHCWVVALAPSNMPRWLIDPTTKYIPQLCESLGIKWQTPSPPDCLYPPLDQIPKGWYYEPNASACFHIDRLALPFLRKLL